MADSSDEGKISHIRIDYAHHLFCNALLGRLFPSDVTLPDLLNIDKENSMKRRRISKACDSCNKRKIKCNGETPCCSNCKDNGYQCTYNRTFLKRGPKPAALRKSDGNSLTGNFISHLVIFWFPQILSVSTMTFWPARKTLNLSPHSKPHSSLGTCIMLSFLKTSQWALCPSPYRLNSIVQRRPFQMASLMGLFIEQPFRRLFQLKSNPPSGRSSRRITKIPATIAQRVLVRPITTSWPSLSSRTVIQETVFLSLRISPNRSSFQTFFVSKLPPRWFSDSRRLTTWSSRSLPFWKRQGRPC